MLVSARTTFALRCPKCGSLEMTSVSRFALSGTNSVRVHCSCGGHVATVQTRRGQVCLQVPCYLCDGLHFMYMDPKSFWDNEMKSILCADTDLQVGVFGSAEEVSGYVKPGGSEMERILEDEAFDDYFDDRQVMHRLLRRVQQMADSGEVACACGHSRAAIDIYSDRVELTCEECNRTRSLPAGSEEDLAALERLSSLEIGDEPPARLRGHRGSKK